MSNPDLDRIRARFADGWGAWISVGDGWLPIIVNLDAALSALEPDLRYHQIKEKFGELRVYTTHDTHPEVEALITAAERRSRETCEACGAAGTMHKSHDGWLRTLCPPCAAEKNHTEVSPQ
ncbi:MAG: hypothetical protein WBO08_03200 [Mycobacterium sp.]|nr:hypothetical protein [Mycobacterium sp.]